MPKLLSVSVPDDLLSEAQQLVDAQGKTKSEFVIDELSGPDDVDSVTGGVADNRSLATAVDAQVHALASGDRQHVIPLGEHRGVRILTPQALLAELA